MYSRHATLHYRVGAFERITGRWSELFYRHDEEVILSKLCMSIGPLALVPNVRPSQREFGIGRECGSRIRGRCSNFKMPTVSRVENVEAHVSLHKWHVLHQIFDQFF